MFSIADIVKECADFNYVNIVNWQEKCYLIKIRNTWYTFSDVLKNEADLFLISNLMRRPSYVSLETALRYYNWIPESVFSITAVTTQKPTSWNTPLGKFTYHSFQPRMFWGYQVAEGFNIADPEKTLIDWLHFNSNKIETADFEGMRFNRDEIGLRVDVRRMERYLQQIDSPTLEMRWRRLQNFL